MGFFFPSVGCASGALQLAPMEMLVGVAKSRTLPADRGSSWAGGRKPLVMRSPQLPFTCTGFHSSHTQPTSNRQTIAAQRSSATSCCPNVSDCQSVVVTIRLMYQTGPAQNPQVEVGIVQVCVERSVPHHSVTLRLFIFPASLLDCHCQPHLLRCRGV